MTLSSRHRIRNSSPGGLRPSTLPLGHGGSPQDWLSHVDGKETFCFFQTAETGNRAPSSGVKGSGANHYPRAPALDRLRLSTLPLTHRFSESFDIRTLTGWDRARYHSDTDSLNLLISEPWRVETEHATTQTQILWIFWYQNLDGLRLSTLPLRHRFSESFDIRTLTGWDWARYHSDTDSLNLLISEPWRVETEHATSQTQILWIFWYQNLDGLRLSALPFRHRFSESFDIRTLTGWDWARYHSDTDSLTGWDWARYHSHTDSLNLLISEPWRVETEHATTHTQILWIFWYQNLDGLRLSTLPLGHRFSESFDIRTLMGWDWARYHSDTDSLTGWDWARYHSHTDSLNLLISEPWRVETEHATIQTQILWIFWYQNLDGLRLSTLPFRHRFSDGLRLSTLPLTHRFSESFDIRTLTGWDWARYHSDTDSLTGWDWARYHSDTDSLTVETEHATTHTQILWIFWYQNLDGLRLSTLPLRHRFSESYDIRTLTGWDWARYHSDTDSLTLLISEPWRVETEHATTQTQILWLFWYQNLDGLRLSTLPLRHRFSESFDIRTLTGWD